MFYKRRTRILHFPGNIDMDSLVPVDSIGEEREICIIFFNITGKFEMNG